jgi:hypothetical protein
MPVTVDHIESVYRAFRKAQADYHNRGYRMPKDFETHFNTKFKETNKKILIKITGWFLTKWQNVDPYEYFKCGFELYENRFTYVKFFKEKILLLYKTRDKNKKREVRITKEGLVKSAMFIKKWMDENNSTLEMYMHERIGEQKLAVDHYLKDKIDASFFVYLMRRGMILSDNDRACIPYIHANFRKISFALNDIRDFTKKLGDKLI